MVKAAVRLRGLGRIVEWQKPLNTSCQKAKAVEYYALKLRFKPDCWRTVLTTPK